MRVLIYDTSEDWHLPYEAKGRRATPCHGLVVAYDERLPGRRQLRQNHTTSHVLGATMGLGLARNTFLINSPPPAFCLGVIQHSQLVQLAAALSKTNGL